MIDRGMLREGMTVHSADGEKLGKILSCGDETFVIEKGWFLPTDYICRYSDVTGIDGDDARLAVTKDEFRRPELGNDDVTPEGTGDELRVPVAEEELEAVKTERGAGEVRLRNERAVEHRAADADVRREEVRVEGDLGDRALDRERDRAAGIPRRDPDDDLA